MPEGRAERAVEAPAKSIGGAEHSGMIKRVMAVAEINKRVPPHVLRHDGCAEVGPDREHGDRRGAESSHVHVHVQPPHQSELHRQTDGRGDGEPFP